MSKSIGTNYIYNVINVVSSLLFPLITFPYATRVIMADGIGLVQFYASIISYVTIFTGLGIPMYGIREIARVRDDKKELSRTTIELISLNLILNVLGYLFVLIMCFTLYKVQINIPLFLLLSSAIVLTTIGCPWFYSGIEDFKYITIRGLIIKIACAVLLFTLVKTKDDLMYYGAYTVLGYIGNNVLNFIRLRNFVSVSDISYCSFKPFRHFKPALSVFLLNIVTSIYINLDSVMLGFFKSPENVGYYTAATRLSHMAVVFVTSLGTVMLPRLSNLIKNNQKEDFNRLARKSYDFVLLLGIPLSFGMIFMAPTLIRLFSGNSFLPAILTLQIISPTIVTVGISNFIGIQILYPLGKVKLVTISTIVGAVINLFLNSILIPKYAQNGAALASVIAEFSVTIAQIIFIRTIIPFKLINKQIILYLLSSVFMSVSCLFLLFLKVNVVFDIIVVPLCGILIYILIILIAKDRLALAIIRNMQQKAFFFRK